LLKPGNVTNVMMHEFLTHRTTNKLTATVKITLNSTGMFTGNENTTAKNVRSRRKHHSTHCKSCINKWWVSNYIPTWMVSVFMCVCLCVC